MKPVFETARGQAAHRAAHEWPLPREPYLPGLTKRPDGDDDVHRIAALAPNPTDPLLWRENVAYLAGFRLYGEGFGWEAHEVWEPVWMHAVPHTAERYLLQGLIQLANARLKFAMKRERAGGRLLGIAAGLIEQASFAGGEEEVMGVDLPTLLRDTRLASDMPGRTPEMHYNA
ncbi:DUF309 domain-containing protein [Rhizobium sp. EC-SD404]|uniref:DUF309 domain-containing protein n=1 Tax=Rhizobium sp. EC-SD404 TaxID=2038389 RepID=UPI0018FE8AB3|nr:DUF309 domain-containing protein [Rhizobium sp. EC-SD404]